MQHFLRSLILILVIAAGTTYVVGQASGYQTPPKAIADIALAPPTPGVNLSPDATYLLLLERTGHPGIDELAQPELRIAGLRINPRTHGPSRTRPYIDIKLQAVKAGKPVSFQGLPEKARISNVQWSPDSRHIALTLDEGDGLSLWIGNVGTMRVERLTKARLNDALRGAPYSWADGGKAIYYKMRPDDLTAPPEKPEVPAGPIVQENLGSTAPVRTYQDLLQNPHDEDVFAYYATTQLMRYDLATRTHRKIGKEGLLAGFSQSPDGRYLLTTWIERPFSYLVPYSRFPQRYVVLDRDGGMVKTIADIPLAEDIPKGFGAVRTGPRNLQWRDDADANLFWVEALDGGDPRQEVEFRDQVYSLAAPFNGSKKKEVACKLRYSGITFGDDQHAVLYENWWSTRHTITSMFTPGNPASKRVLFDRSTEDRYNAPGSFETKSTPSGGRVLDINKSAGLLYLTGSGASPEGDRPFVRSMSIATGELNELWRSEAPYYEYPVAFVGEDKRQILTRRESQEEQPNYYLRDLQTGQLTQITHFEHPYPSLRGITKQELRFKRADGVDMSGDLYLPEGYDVKKDGPLPALMWAYPREYKSAAMAGQVSGSPYSFIRVNYGSPIFWVVRGYAVLANASMPVVGEGDKEPNDSFRQQLVMNAEAAINTLVDMGVADRDRVAIGGHSYGAFMTANLLAHSDLFAAGIARSGAYNRTLTPFGFQREERTYWEAPEVYYTMSPFMHADKVNEPILLIHGEADNNSGTFPVQSKRFYSALKGMGATARLVMLPYESHGYRAEESILHMLWEQDQWLEKYVKNKGKSGAATGTSKS
ncbi:MAG: prolyl oligopeptidase family serine peptidase [Saprospiraceae bacterium]|nr:prolyl oligopeptidase family serine peptidase [Saprospiraceae bacterium]